MNTNDFELSSVIYKINDSFKLPITYIDEKHELKKNMSGKGHIKYMIKAYKRMEDYFRAMGINPEDPQYN